MVRISITLQLLLVGCFLLFIPLSAISEELPQIELPEYVITGIEKAIRISGDKLPVKSVPRSISLRQLQPTNRPELIATGIMQAPTRPDISTVLNEGRLNASITGGQFTMFGGSVDHAKVLESWTLTAESAYDHHPNRTTPGMSSAYSAGISGTTYITEKNGISTHLSFDRSGFNLNDGLSDKSGYISDFQFSATTAPARLFSGRFAAYVSYDKLKIDQYVTKDSDLLALNLNYSTKLASGWLESRASVSYDSYSDLSLVTLSSGYNQPIWLGWMARISGTLAAAQNSIPGDLTNGYIGFALEHPSLFGGKVTLLRDSGVEMHYMKALMNRWYMVESASTVSETTSNLTLHYERDITDRLTGNMSVASITKRHEPFPVLSSGSWNLEPRRIGTLLSTARLDYELAYSLTALAYAINDQSESHGISPGTKAVQRPEWRVGSELRYRWQKWSLNNKLEWQSSTAIDFVGLNKTPERLTDNLAVSRSFNDKIELQLGVDNLFNSSFYEFTGYDYNPLTVYLKINYRNIF